MFLHNTQHKKKVSVSLNKKKNQFKKDSHHTIRETTITVARRRIFY